jgi:hypothetical protein
MACDAYEEDMKLIPLTQDESDAIETAFLKAYAAYRLLSACGEPKLFTSAMEAELSNLWVWSRMDFSSPDQLSRVLILLLCLLDKAQSGIDSFNATTCADVHRCALQTLWQAMSDCVEVLHNTIDACATRETDKVTT